jgi:hypothetical protein
MADYLKRLVLAAPHVLERAEMWQSVLLVTIALAGLGSVVAWVTHEVSPFVSAFGLAFAVGSLVSAAGRRVWEQERLEGDALRRELDALKPASGGVPKNRDALVAAITKLEFAALDVGHYYTLPALASTGWRRWALAPTAVLWIGASLMLFQQSRKRLIDAASQYRQEQRISGIGFEASLDEFYEVCKRTAKWRSMDILNRHRMASPEEVETTIESIRTGSRSLLSALDSGAAFQTTGR